MLKIFFFTLAACVASSVSAQNSTRPNPVDPKAAVPVLPYESAFKDYRPYVDPEIARWRESNREIGRLGGRVGHMPQATGAAGEPPANAPVPAGHGGHK